MRLVISFNLTYHTWFKYLRFSSYERFRDYCPNHPWGTPSCPAFQPHTSTPLWSSPLKLNQRAARIRGPFLSSSCPLGDSAPALFVWPFWCQSSQLKRCSSFYLLVSFSFTPAEGASSMTLAISLLLCLVPSASLWSQGQSNMAAAMAAVPGEFVNVRACLHSFWFVPLGLK